MCGMKGCAGTDGFRKEDNFPTAFSPAEDVLRNAGSSSLRFKSAGRDKEASSKQAAKAFWRFAATKIWKLALSHSHFLQFLVCHSYSWSVSRSLSVGELDENKNLFKVTRKLQFRK